MDKSLFSDVGNGFDAATGKVEVGHGLPCKNSQRVHPIRSDVYQPISRKRRQPNEEHLLFLNELTKTFIELFVNLAMMCPQLAAKIDISGVITLLEPYQQAKLKRRGYVVRLQTIYWRFVKATANNLTN